MRIINHVFSFLFLFCLSCSQGNKNAFAPLFFSDNNYDARTDVVLLRSDNKYTLVSYGGYSPQSAACVIKSTGKIAGSQLNGYLVDVNTNIVSYRIDSKRKIPFHAVLKDSSFEITNAEVTDLCGLNSNFVKQYFRITDKKVLQGSIDNFIELMQDSKGNEDLLPALKEALSQLKR